jgi:hypothetical protein
LQQAWKEDKEVNYAKEETDKKEKEVIPLKSRGFPKKEG